MLVSFLGWLVCLGLVSASSIGVYTTFVIPGNVTVVTGGGGGGGVFLVGQDLFINGDGTVFLSRDSLFSGVFSYSLAGGVADPLSVSVRLLTPGGDVPVFFEKSGFGQFVFSFDFEGYEPGFYEFVVVADGYSKSFVVEVSDAPILEVYALSIWGGVSGFFVFVWGWLVEGLNGLLFGILVFVVVGGWLVYKKIFKGGN